MNLVLGSYTNNVYYDYATCNFIEIFPGDCDEKKNTKNIRGLRVFLWN